MAKAAVTRSIRDDHQKNFLKIFNGLTGKHSRWEIWEDFVTLTAIEISNSTDKVNATERTKMYQTIISKYSAKERDGMAEMLAEVVMGMEQNPDQDFLGSLYMMCELGNDHAGQFFTPYDVCRCMAEITFNPKLHPDMEGFISVSDPACGAGATLLAFLNVCKRRNICYHNKVLVIAQDIDFIVGLMCYINNGAAAAIIWAVFNSLACIFFGLFAEYIPTVRRIMQSKVMFYFIGFLTVFQTWTQMSGIYEIFGDTPIGTTGGTLIVYGTCLVFLFMLLKEGMIRNVLSDGFSWVVVYGLLAVVVIAALVYTHGAFVNIDPGLTAAGIQTGLYKGFLLLPGPFTYPYYYSLFSYNDKNEDGTQHGNMKKSFVLAGVMFGVYMVLAALLTWVNFSPLLNTLKAILITIIALSSLSTYLYSEYLVFGENIGFLIDVLTVTSWQLVIPLGVMGIWTLMSELRVYIIIFVLLASVVLHLVSDRKEDAR